MPNKEVRRPRDMTREAALDIIRQLHADLGRPISRKEFQERYGLNHYWIDRTFPGGWAEVRSLIGMDPFPKTPLRYSDDELLKRFHHAVAELGRVPRWCDLTRLTRISTAAFYHRFGRMGALLDRYRDWLQQHHPDSPLRHLIDAAPPPRPGPKSARPQRQHAPPFPRSRVSASPRPQPTRTRSRRSRAGPSAGRHSPPSTPHPHPHPEHATRFGEPIDCRHMRHAPVNEQGVVLLFGILAPDLGFLVESVQHGFPDCEAKQAIDPHGRTWRHVRIEFEYRSRNFRDHGHDPTACDLLICGQHDWPECPLEVLELRAIVTDSANNPQPPP